MHAPPAVYLDPEVETKLQHRLKRIEGQVRGLQRLLAEHESCDDLLIQIGAVKQALNAVMTELLDGHLDSCVAESLRRGDRDALGSLKRALTYALKYGG